MNATHFNGRDAKSGDLSMVDSGGVELIDRVRSANVARHNTKIPKR